MTGTAIPERPRFEMICLEDDEDGEHVCYLTLGHDGEHVWTPFRNGRSADA